jgi:hypothetical protein
VAWILQVMCTPHTPSSRTGGAGQFQGVCAWLTAAVLGFGVRVLWADVHTLIQIHSAACGRFSEMPADAVTTVRMVASVDVCQQLVSCSCCLAVC